MYSHNQSRQEFLLGTVEEANLRARRDEMLGAHGSPSPDQPGDAPDLV
jgi:hypothetical protein